MLRTRGRVRFPCPLWPPRVWSALASRYLCGGQVCFGGAVGSWPAGLGPQRTLQSASPLRQRRTALSSGQRDVVGCCPYRSFCSAWFLPYPLTERDEVGSCLGQRANLVCHAGVADTGQLEKFCPPLHALHDGRELRAFGLVTPAVGFPEHHVVGISLCREHGIMTAAQTPNTGDTIRLKTAECAA